MNDPVNYVDLFGVTSTDAGNGSSPKVTFSSDMLSKGSVGFDENPKIAIDSSILSNGIFNGIDTKNSIVVACGSDSTIGRCFSNEATFNLNDTSILGSKDVYIGGQSSESQSSQLLRQGAIEMLLGGILDNGAPFIGGALASVTGGSGVLTIPLIKAFGITLQIDGAAKIAQGTVLAATEGNWSGDSDNKNDDDENSFKEKRYEPRDVNEAIRQFKSNKKFRDYFHREYKPSEKVTTYSRNNPDLSDQQIADCYKEWLNLQKLGEF